MNKVTLYLASVLAVIAGVMHSTLVAFHNVASLPLETIFFFTSGITQIVISAWFFRHKTLKSAVSLFAINGALASTWFLTRVFRAPFMDSPKGLSTLGISVIFVGVGSMISIALWKWSKKHNIKDIHGYSYAAVIAVAIGLSLLSGSFVYAGGRLGEFVFPDRKLNHSHDHGGHSDNDSQHHSSSSKDKRQIEAGLNKTKTSSKKQKNKDKNKKKEKENSENNSHGHSDGHAHN